MKHYFALFSMVFTAVAICGLLLVFVSDYNIL